MRLTERSVSVTEEKRIVTGLIVSTKVCKELVPHIELDYFTNSYLQRIASWSIDFFQEFDKAPFKHINDIFESESNRLQESETELIGELLTNLGKQYSGEDVNSEYIVQSAEEYFRSRELEIVTNNISIHKEKGDLEAAEREIDRYNRVSISLDENIYINPGDSATIDRLYKKRDEQQIDFFQFPGDLGQFLGNDKPGDVVAITAPAKRGKSFLLSKYVQHGVMSRKRCLKWSIEMTDTEEIERFDKSFLPMVDKESGMYRYPVFDCMKNQTSDCGERNSGVIVREDPESDLEEDPDHVICTKCKDDPNEYTRYVPTVYFEEMHREDRSIFTARNKLRQFRPLMNKYARIVVRPKYSLTYDLMMRDLEVMDSRYGFIPSIIVIDYIDILAISSIHDDWKLEDEKWKLLQKIAGRTKCFVVTATQANKEGAKAAVLHGTDQAGYYGKSRHVNKMIAINQTFTEKSNGLWRCGVTDSRSGRQSYEDNCIVLQDLKAGQMHVDSYWPGKFWNF